VEGVPLAETETFDDGIVAEAGVRSTKSPHYTAFHLESTFEALTHGQARVKRCVDIVAAALGLVCLAPVYLVVAVLVSLDSPGPVLFSQTRVGLRGRTFRMLKFRTMYEGADEEKDAVAELNQADDVRLFKIPADPRVTRLGRVLRRWSLDELPQLYNVLMGEMSLVGPRPFFESDLDDYEAHHFRRLSVPAGLTGLWQISGRSEIVDFEEVVRLDRHYIENWSLAMDFRILARTLPAVMSRRGAY
jgi:lipopolysaccharide/colanic/teichoic acid biosynthesis glycosyltransferase